MEKLQRFAFPVIIVYLWTMMILLGAIVLETFMVYPNIFHDPPRSLELALEFMTVTGPADFFRPLGFLSWLAGIGALALGWSSRPARWWILFSLLMIVAEGVVSRFYFWPRNAIMFSEGTAVHSAEVLRQTAAEFVTVHWLRVGFNALSAAAIFVGFMAFYRQQVLAQAGAAGARAADSGSTTDRDDHVAGRSARAMNAHAVTR